MNVAILGATGSIGIQTVEVIEEYGYHLVAFSSGKNITKTRELILRFQPKLVSVMNETDAIELQNEFPSTRLLFGEIGLIEVAQYQEAEILVNALVGFVGLEPTVAAIKAKKTIALANKETLVVAGELIMPLTKEYGITIYPVDSEHSAIAQCLQNTEDKIDSLIITASGGSFRHKTRTELQSVTVKDALKHPNWNMGDKITIDSATMMNKGFEVIEAHHLFGVPYQNIETILHPESIVHSMVKFQDGSILAQLGEPDMKLPIRYALHKGHHVASSIRLADILIGKTLQFEELSMERYPLLKLAYEVGEEGGILPCVMNAASEVAVALFLKEIISFLDIETIVFEWVNKTKNEPVESMEQLKWIDNLVRDEILARYQN